MSAYKNAQTRGGKIVKLTDNERCVTHNQLPWKKVPGISALTLSGNGKNFIRISLNILYTYRSNLMSFALFLLCLCVVVSYFRYFMLFHVPLFFALHFTKYIFLGTLFFGFCLHRNFHPSSKLNVSKIHCLLRIIPLNFLIFFFSQKLGTFMSLPSI